MSGIGVESRLLLVHGRDAAVGQPRLASCPCDEDDAHHEERHGEDAGSDDLALYIVEAEEVLQLVLDGDEVFVLFEQFALGGGNRHHIIGCYEQALQGIVALVFLAREDVECQSDNLVALGGIDIRANLMAQLHILKSLERHAVDTQDFYLSLGLGLHRRLVGPGGHAVVVAEDDIGQAARLDLLRHDAASPVGRPVAFAGDILQFVVAAHGIGESLVTLLRRRGAHGARDLEYERLAAGSGHLAGYGERIKADDTACLHIITADESRIIVGFRLSVEEDHGNALRPDLGDSRRDGSRLIGRHHE